MSAQSSQSAQSAQPSHQLTLVESLMEHIDSFQSGNANEMTYLSAMNALRDLHAYVKKTEKIQAVSQKSSIVVTLDGEEFFIEEYQGARLAIRFTDNYAYSSNTGEFVGVWNESTSTVEELPFDEEEEEEEEE